MGWVEDEDPSGAVAGTVHRWSGWTRVVTGEVVDSGRMLGVF